MKTLLANFPPSLTGFNLSTISAIITGIWTIAICLLLVASFIMTVIAIWGGISWGTVGKNFLLSLILIISNIIILSVFSSLYIKRDGLTLIANITTFSAFGLFLFSNAIIVFIVCAMYEKASWATVFKMIITAVVLYIPIAIFSSV